ncbi:MAG: AAA family ATPase [Candidatus Brocadiales bacterium]|nr:AAA family ATPase [Candidatus Brocadiales bacterium]
MYYEYWNLKKSPFDNVPDPTMYAACHASMESAIAETQFAIEEGEDCLSVIVGDVGLGKTMSIRIVIDSLGSEKYKIALITNPSTTFVQILREIIGQITGKPCEERKKDDLLEIFNRILFETSDEGKKVLVFIDEANVMSPKKLEDLRLLTNMQEDSRNLFTMVLVGQMELAKRLEHPKKANFFQRIGTYCRIEKIPTEGQLKTYVETRLQRAGGSGKIFTEDSFHVMWECSEHGVPRLINKICKLSLKAGETNELAEIDGEIIRQIGDRFKKITRPVGAKRRQRKRSEDETAPVPANGFLGGSEINSEGQGEKTVKPIDKKEALPGPVLCLQVDGEKELMHEAAESRDKEVSVCTKRTTEKESAILNVIAQEIGKFPEGGRFADEQIHSGDAAVDQEEHDEVDIGGRRFQLDISSSLIEEARGSDQDQCNKLAGTIAAQALRDNSELKKVAASADPVPIWNEIKKFVLCKIGR